MWYITLDNGPSWDDYGPFACKRKAKAFGRWLVGLDDIVSIFKVGA